jgi:hypothetical protein
MKNRPLSLALPLAVCSLLASGLAHADGTGNQLGQSGQILLDASLQAKLDHTTQTFMGESRSETVITLNPGLLYFVSPTVALGGSLSLGYQAGENDASQTSVGFGPIFALHFALSERVSLLPNAGLAYVYVSFSQGSQNASGHAIAAEVTVPILFHLVPHFFIGAGPHFIRVFENKIESQDGPTSTNVGVGLFIGGWI